jgi:hypothetical protein
VKLTRSLLVLVLLAVLVAPSAGLSLDHFDKLWIQRRADVAEDDAKDYTDAYVDSLQAQIDSLSSALDTSDVGGQIILWYGDSADVPAGWSVCNGDTWFNTDSTDTLIEPDMVGRFIVCAGGVGNYSPSDTGGVDSTDFAHTHTISSSGTHTHTIPWEPGEDLAMGEDWTKPNETAEDGDHDHGGATGSSLAYVDNRPRYIALWLLMRVKF